MYLGSLWGTKKTGALLLPFPDQNYRRKGAVLNVAAGLPEYIQGICWDVSLWDSSLTDDVIDGACQMFHAGMTCGNPTNVLDVLLQQAKLA